MNAGLGLIERCVYVQVIARLGDVKRGNGVDLPGERHSKATPCSAQVVEPGIRYNAGSSRPRLRVCRLQDRQGSTGCVGTYQDTPYST
jgi:hypothetical protein